MKNLFVPYLIAKQLKENKFNEPCFGLFGQDESLVMKQIPNQQECEQYFGGILAPIYQQVIDWFSDEHLIFIAPVCKEWLHTFTCTLNHSNIVNIIDETNEYHNIYKAYNEAFGIAFKMLEEREKEYEQKTK